MSERSRLRRWSDRWLGSAALALAAIVTAVDGGFVPLVAAGLLAVGAVGISPLVFPRSGSDVDARRVAKESQRPLVYWRPGCMYCLRLRFALGRRGNRAVWVDVSTDAEASARVRTANGGNETVPTVFVGDETRTNPSPSWVRAQLQGVGT